ncbi:MAG: hypothetical protein IJ192_04785 [Clostridia bacterium]|nr:hypothetical protein [Clostridia bacterium]MBR2176952.1 hypothetical protein [Clostridia bacterium]
MNSHDLNVPNCYAEWLDWFDLLQKKSISMNELQLLKNGSCSDSHTTIEYFEKQLIKTENIMLKRYLGEFGKTLEIYLSYGEYDRLYEPFQLLAKQFTVCLFFVDLQFMSLEFKRELSRSVISNAKDHWKKAVKNIYTACIESNSTVLEDQLYMINKIRLFGDCE